MDHFGIGAALEGVAKIYFQSARRTGRTEHLIASLKDGDCVAFIDSGAAREFQTRCIDAGKRIDTVTVSVDRVNEFAHLQKRCKGRLVFDHDWIEAYYLNSLSRTSRWIDGMQQELSAKDAEPLEAPRFDPRWDMTR